MVLKFICPPVSGNGGTETVLVNVVNYLVKFYPVNLYLTSKPENSYWLTQIDKNVKIIRFNSNNRFFKMIYLLRIFIFSKNQDHFIILGGNVVNLAINIRTILYKNWQVTSWIHYSLFQQHYFKPLKLKAADDHWAISSSIRKQLLEIGVPSSKIHLIFNPIHRQKQIIKLNQSNTLHLVYVGKIMLNGQKNLKELLDAVSLYDGSVHISLFGKDFSNGEVKHYISKLGIEKLCTFYSWSKDPWETISQKIEPDALIMTSRYEGLPMVALESMSYGIPCILADFDGASDIVKDGINGYIYQQHNIQDLLQKLAYIKNDKFSSQKIVDSIINFYEENYYQRIHKYFNDIKQ